MSPDAAVAIAVDVRARKLFDALAFFMTRYERLHRRLTEELPS